MSWSERDPGSGDTGALRARGGTMNTIVLQLDHARTQVRRTHSETLTPDRWSGTAAEAFRQTCTDHVSRLSSFIDFLAPYSAALQIYAYEVEDIAEQSHQLTLSSTAALEKIAAMATSSSGPRACLLTV